MGEAAEMILNGEVCQYCGEFMFDEDGELDSPGFPQSCSACRGNNGNEDEKFVMMEALKELSEKYPKQYKKILTLLGVKDE